MHLKPYAVVVALGGMAACCGCSRDKRPSAATEQAEQAPPERASDAGAVARLRDRGQAVRDSAAAEIRKTLAENPAASGDHGEAYWKEKLAELKPGMTEAALQAATGATSEGGASSGQSSSTSFRLDDYWTVVVHFDLPDSLRKVGPLSRSARSLWVEPPKAFTGRWVTYYVNGNVKADIQYRDGNYERFSSYYDNGQLSSAQVYVRGEIDGPEIGYHFDGSKAYEIRYSKGKPVGRWVHWFSNGKQQSEESYVDGKLEGPTMHWRQDGTRSSRIDYSKGQETGQASWDEHGTLQYAHGSAQNAGP